MIQQLVTEILRYQQLFLSCDGWSWYLAINDEMKKIEKRKNGEVAIKSKGVINLESRDQSI